MKKIALVLAMTGVAAYGQNNNSPATAIVWQDLDSNLENLHQRLVATQTDNSQGLREIESMLIGNDYVLTSIDSVSTLPEGLNCHCDSAEVTLVFSKKLSGDAPASSGYTLVVAYGAGHLGHNPNAGASINALTLQYKGAAQ